MTYLRNDISKVDNKMLDNNVQLGNDKRLRLDSMASMSIGEIINLYKQGYTLEEKNYHLENSGYIHNLTYTIDCSGTPTLDQSSTQENIDDFIPFGMSNAYAQKFTPTSRCLSSVTIKLRKVYGGYATVRICSDIGGYPDFPSSNLGEFTRYDYELSTSFTEVNFPLNILLPNLNPIWIVITSMYDPNISDPTEFIDVASIYLASETNFASKSGNNPWMYNTGKPVFKTFKLNYSTTPNLTTIAVTPTTASINVGATQQITAVCKDQNNVTMTCPTLTWISSDTLKATVSSSGLVSGVAAGTVNVTAGYSTITSNVSAITVSSSVSVLTSISPANPVIQIGGMQQFTAKDQNNSAITTGVTWAKTAGVGSINASGVYSSGSTSGTATISATYSGVTITTSITVPSVASILSSIFPTSATVQIGNTQQFTAKDQNNIPITTVVTWEVSTGVGTISTTGLYSAGSTAGGATVSATYSGVTKTASITVSTTPPATGEDGAGMLFGIVGIAAIAMMMTSKKQPSSGGLVGMGKAPAE